MLLRTHLAITLAAMFLILPYIENEVIFVIVILISTILPDIDSARSHVGRSFLLRPLQWMTKHRGILHSFTIAGLLAILFAIFVPVVALPFILGYGLHLVADAWSKEGIRPFWPFDMRVKGNLKVGGYIEETLFIVFVILDIIFLVLLLI